MFDFEFPSYACWLSEQEFTIKLLLLLMV